MSYKRLWIALALVLVISFAVLDGVGVKVISNAPPVPVQRATPSSIQEEHKHLRHELDAALASGGKTAGAAKMVERLLLPHFQAVEATRCHLGLLEAIAHNRSLSGEQVQQAINMADQLETNYEQMAQEHQFSSADLPKTRMSQKRPLRRPQNDGERAQKEARTAPN